MIGSANLFLQQLSTPELPSSFLKHKKNSFLRFQSMPMSTIFRFLMVKQQKQLKLLQKCGIGWVRLDLLAPMLLWVLAVEQSRM